MASSKQDLQKLVVRPVLEQVSLSAYTTLGVGGPADFLVEVSSKQEAVSILEFANQCQIPTTFLGGGSNVVISDKGIRGVVIRNLIQDFELIADKALKTTDKKVKPRLAQLNKKEFYSNELAPSFDDSTEQVVVSAGSGLKLAVLIQKCLNQGITGPEWFSGIPGSVGGGVYMNMHGGNYFFSDFVVKAETVDSSGQIKNYEAAELAFSYDNSRFHAQKEFITTVWFQFYKGDLEKARNIVSAWGGQKIAHQPQRSCGCVFQNINQEDQERLGLPTPSIGYIIDHVLELKGKQVGGARISPQHGAFIENTGKATAADVLTLIEEIETKAREKLDISLIKEIELLGDFN
ncbi:FAD-binding protein [Candidatus Beckwithbacteria bacterium]|nr:FAD-binding protein [Candidatus Beckwithbacteria bacterium]